MKDQVNLSGAFKIVAGIFILVGLHSIYCWVHTGSGPCLV